MMPTTDPDRATLWPAIFCALVYIGAISIFSRYASVPYLQGMFFYLLVCLSGVPALLQKRFKQAASYLAVFLVFLCISSL